MQINLSFAKFFAFNGKKKESEEVPPVVENDNRTLKQLEHEKLLLETKLLDLDLIKKKAEVEKAKKVLWRIQAMAGLGFAFAVSVFQLLGPIINFFDARTKQYEFQLNSSMVALIDKPSATLNEKIRAINLLSYYEYNSIPVLTYYIETDQDQVRNAAIKILTDIFRFSEKKEESFERVLQSLSNFISIIDSEKQFYAYKGYITFFQDIMSDLSTEELDKLSKLIKSNQGALNKLNPATFAPANADLIMKIEQEKSKRWKGSFFSFFF